MLVAASVAFAAVVLDTTIVNVALPSIGRDLGAGIAGLQWVVDGYVVIFSALLLSTGALSDRLGARRAFVLGLLGFMIASAGCGLAPSLGVLIGARVVQGAAAALMLPASLALVQQSHEEAADRARAIAIWTAAGGGAVAAGPVLGGVLTTALGWPAIFFVNVPLGLVGLATIRKAPRSPRSQVRTDVAGQVLAVVALGALAVGIIDVGTDGVGRLVSTGGLLIFVAASVSFVLVERRVRAPVLPLEILRRPIVAGMLITGLILNLAFYGQVFVLSFFFQQQLGHSAMTAGLMFLPMTALVTASNMFAGRLTVRLGPRVPLIIGMLVLAAGMLIMLVIQQGSRLPIIELLLVPLGIGGGLSVPPLTSALMDSLPTGQAGLAAGALNASRQLGGAIGVALNGALIAADFMTGFRATLLIGAVAVGGTCAAIAYVMRNHRRSVGGPDERS